MDSARIDPVKIIEKYYTKNSDLYYTLLIHSEKVKDKALEIAKNKPKLKANVEFIREAALLHDIGIFMCYAPRIHCRGEHKYIAHGYLGAEILRNEGLPAHALVCERHTGTGITLETIKKQRLPLPERDMSPISIEEQIICYADKFFSKSNLTEAHTLEDIRKELSKFGEKQVETFDKWHKMFEG